MSTKTSISFLKDRRSFINRRAAAGALALLLVIGLLPILTSSVLAQSGNAQMSNSNRIITYQAQILKKGEPIPDGRYTITASLYNDADGMNLVWRSSYAVDVKGGIANLMLGEVRNGGVPLPEVGLDGPLYLGISVGSSTGNLTGLGEEMRPLTRLSSSVNALSVADSSITSSKIAADYISGVTVDGERITKKGGQLNLEAGSGIRLSFDKESEALRFEIPPAPTANGNGTGSTNNPCGTNDDASQGTNQISGGCANTIYSYSGWVPFDYCTIGGGDSNRITSVVDIDTNGGNEGAWWHTIGGGRKNTILTEIESGNATQQKVMGASTIGGGQENLNASPWGTIGGGRKNVIAYAFPTIDTEAGKNMLYNVIAGGDSNRITRLTLGSVIGGGSGNHIHGNDKRWNPYNFITIGGGDTNTALGEGDVIAGGHRNIVASQFGVISGGSEGSIGLNSHYATIAGGELNTIDTGAPYSTIGGGYSNRVQGRYSVISGGESNQINHVEADHNFTGGGYGNIQNNPSLGVIGGGWDNLLDTSAWASSIVGGVENVVRSSRAVLGGGSGNAIEKYDDLSVLVGGESNSVWAGHSFLGGGYRNLNHSIKGVLVGGAEDTVRSSYTFLGGGHGNYIDWNSDSAVLVGGTQNYIDWGHNSFLGGGLQDSLKASYAVLGGGTLNKISEAGAYSTIGGGRKNLVEGPYGFIGGGDSNHIMETMSTKSVIGGGQGNALKVSCWGIIGGGKRNRIWTESIDSDDAPNFSSILGGANNLIDSATYSAIGGGSGNRIGSKASHAVIPGGRFLEAQSYNQIVMGRHNKAKGSSTSSSIMPDDPLVIVGNGSATNSRSNAFEISNNGHSIVFHQNGNTHLGPPIIVGGTYKDNTILAWGDIEVNTQNSLPSVNADFGVKRVEPIAMGIYKITLDIIDADLAPHLINKASITVTPIDDRRETDTTASCGYATASRVFITGGEVQFLVRTYGSGEPGCSKQDMSFMFKVTGRKDN